MDYQKGTTLEGLGLRAAVKKRFDAAGGASPAANWGCWYKNVEKHNKEMETITMKWQKAKDSLPCSSHSGGGLRMTW